MSAEEKKKSSILYRELSFAWLRRHPVRWLFVFLMAAQALIALAEFPPSELLSGDPIVTVDYPAHYSYFVELRRMLLEEGRFQGYAVSRLAGFPLGPLSAPSDFAPVVLSAPFFFVDDAVFFKAFVFAVLLAGPIVFLLAAKFMGLDAFPSCVLVLTGFAIWNLGLEANSMKEFGMFGFLLPSVFVVLLLGACERYALKPGFASWLLLAALVAFIVFCHVLGVLIAAPCVLLWWGASVRRMSFRGHLAFLSAVAAGLAVTWSWYGGVPSQLKYVIGVESMCWASGPIRSVRDVFPIGVPWRHLVFFTGCAGAVSMLFRRRAALGAAVLAGGISMKLLADLGAYSAILERTEPARFHVPSVFILAVGTAFGVVFLVDAGRSLASRRICLSHLGLSALVVAGWVYPATQVFYPFWILEALSAAPFKLKASFNLAEKELLGYLKENPDDRGRTMYESMAAPTWGAPLGHKGQFGCLLPVLASGQWMGTEQFNTRLAHAIWSANAMRQVQGMKEADFDRWLRAYVERYNIVRAVTATAFLRDAFLRGGARIEKEVGGCAVLSLPREGSYVLRGVAKARASSNAIEVTDIRTTELVLSYHWLEGLRASGRASVFPVGLAEDGVPFIGVRTPDRSPVRIEFFP